MNKEMQELLDKADATPRLFKTHLVAHQAAIEIARIAHEGQVDKGGQPYISHPIRVMNAEFCHHCPYFRSDRFSLTGLEVETDLEECKYSTLPVKMKDRLNKRSLNLINCIPASDNQSESEIKKLIDAVKERL